MRVRQRSRRAGFSLVEMAIATGLLGLVLGSAVMVQKAGVGVQRTVATRAALENEARRALDRIATELTTAVSDGLGLIDVDEVGGEFGVEELTFNQVVDCVGGVAQIGPDVRVAYLPDTNRLILVRNVGLPNQRTVVLSRSVAALAPGETLDATDENGNGIVDERGFNIARDGDLLILRLTLSRADLDGRVVVHSMETSVRLRN